MPIITAAVRALQLVQQAVPGYRKAMRELLEDDFDTLEVVIWPGWLTADLADHEIDGARRCFLSILPDPQDAERDRAIRRVAARVPVPLEDVEDADVCHSEHVETRRFLVIGGRVIALWSRRRDPLAAFNARSAARRYCAAMALERTHPAFEDRRAARAALVASHQAVEAAEHDYREAFAA